MDVIDWLKLILAGITAGIGLALLLGWFLFRVVKGDHRD
jgi:high-affinity Fe2+/Pb2+ permease